MTTARTTAERLIPALSYRVLTPLYDPVMRTLLREATWKRQLMGVATLQPGEQVLDLGCGTGTLTLLLKQQNPQILRQQSLVWMLIQKCSPLRRRREPRLD